MVLPWRWWLGLRVVVLGFSKGRGFAASFFSTTPRPPFKGALVAALLCTRCKNQSIGFAFHSHICIFTPDGVEILFRSLQKSKHRLCFSLAYYVYLPLTG